MHIRPSRATITTMTVGGQLSCERMNLLDIRREVERGGTPFAIQVTRTLKRKRVAAAAARQLPPEKPAGIDDLYVEIEGGDIVRVRVDLATWTPVDVLRAAADKPVTDQPADKPVTDQPADHMLLLGTRSLNHAKTLEDMHVYAGAVLRACPKPTFQNQLTLSAGTKSVKLFVNGSVHVTGCKSHRDFYAVAEAVCELVGRTDVRPEVASMNIMMINMNFSLNARIKLRPMAAELLREFLADYDEDNYPGLKLRVPVSSGTSVSVLVFQSGSAIISGVKVPSDLADAYETVVRALDRFPQHVVFEQHHHKPMAPAASKTMAAAFDVRNGYPIAQFHLCL